MSKKALTYKEAGVDIDAGNTLVDRIKPFVAQTRRSEVLSGIGGFGGLFSLPTDRYKDPVLVSGTDGVGTKLMLAQALNKHDTIGIDLVAMCVNDILVQGAEPLFFLDYFACGRLDVDVATAVVGGIAEGCKQAGAALIGGETAEMPDMYADGEYDLAGFCVGAVDRGDLIDGSTIVAGDMLIALPSSGAHSNGYSLIRKVVDRAGDATIDGLPAMETLLTPTRIYVDTVLALMREVSIKGIAHITGGGITENLPRILPAHLHAEIHTSSWEPGAVFEYLAEHGNIDVDEMRRTFNCGVGMIIATNTDEVDKALDSLHASGESAWPIGRIAEGGGDVRYL